MDVEIKTNNSLDALGMTSRTLAPRVAAGRGRPWLRTRRQHTLEISSHAVGLWLCLLIPEAKQRGRWVCWFSSHTL